MKILPTILEMKNPILIFIKKLFRLDKHSFFFPLCLNIIIILFFIGSSTWNILLVIKSQLLILNLFILVYIYLYKRITKISEENLKRLTFQSSIILSIFSLISLFVVDFYSSYLLTLIIGSIFGELKFIIETTLVLFGFIAIIYHGIKFNYIIKLTLVSLIIVILSQSDKIYTMNFSYIFSTSLFIGTLSGIFLVVSYQKIIKPLYKSINPFLFFTITGTMIFILNFSSNLLINYSNHYNHNFNELLLSTLPSFFLYALWGLYFKFFQNNNFLDYY